MIVNKLDEWIVVGNVMGLFFCILVVFKDNYDVVGMNIMGVCFDFVNSKLLEDVLIVIVLRNVGVVIFGKVNFYEMVFEGLIVLFLGG